MNELSYKTQGLPYKEEEEEEEEEEAYEHCFAFGQKPTRTL